MESVNMKAGVVFNMKEDQNIPFKKKKKKRWGDGMLE